MRIYCQLPMKLPRVDKRFRPYYELLEKHYGKVKRTDTEITIKDVEGFDNPEWLHYPGLRLFNDAELLKTLIAAEKDGYDGISIACFHDPALQEAKQLLTIPVMGLAEPSIHFACMIGNKFAIVTSAEKFIPSMEEHVHRYGLECKAIDKSPVRAIMVQEEDIVSSPNWIDKFTEVAAGCVEDGAEVIIPGCGLMSPMLTQAGITEIQGAAIVEPLSVSLKLIEAMVDMHRAKMPVVSRKSSYSSVSKIMIKKALDSLCRGPD